MATQLENLVVRFMLDANHLTRGLRSMQSTIGNVVSNITAMGTKLTLGITTPLTIMGKTAVEQFAKFEDAMQKAFTTAGDVTQRLKVAMTDQARMMARDSVSSAVDLANAYRHLAASGMTAKQSMETLPIVNKFAVAGLMDLEHATNLLVDSQAAMGLRVKDNVQNLKNMTRVANVLTKAGVMSTTDPEQIARAVKTKSGAQARLIGKDIEEVAAVLGVMASVGTKAELAGEQLYIAMRDLQQAAMDNADVFAEWNIRVFDSFGEMRNLADIIEDMEKHMGSASDEQKKFILGQLGFTSRSVAATAMLIGLSDQIRQYEAELRKTDDTIGRMAAGNQASFLAQLSMMKNKVIDVAISFGQVMAPYIIELNKHIEEAIKWFDELSHFEKDMIVLGAAVGAVVGPVLLLAGAMAGPLFGAISLVSGAIGALASPFVLVGAAIAGLLVWVVGPEGLANAWNSVTENIGAFVKNSIGFFANFQHNIVALVDFVGAHWTELLSDLEQIVRILVANAIDDIGTIMAAMTRIIMVLIDKVFSKDFVSGLVAGLVKAGEILTKWFGMILEKASKFFIVIAQGLATALSGGMIRMKRPEEGGEAYNLWNRVEQDAAKSRTEGIGPAIKNILAEELANLKMFSLNKQKDPITGEYGFKSALTGRPDLKFGMMSGSKGTPAGMLNGVETAATAFFDSLFNPVMKGLKNAEDSLARKFMYARNEKAFAMGLGGRSPEWMNKNLAKIEERFAMGGEDFINDNQIAASEAAKAQEEAQKLFEAGNRSAEALGLYSQGGAEAKLRAIAGPAKQANQTEADQLKQLQLHSKVLNSIDKNIKKAAVLAQADIA